MYIKLYQGAKMLDEIAPKWFGLADSQVSATLTQYPEIYQSYINAFDTAKKSFFVAAVFDDADLVAVFPLRLVQRRIKGIKLRALEFPQLPIPIREVLISQSSNKNEVFECLLEGLAQQIGSNWDYICFKGVLKNFEVLLLFLCHRDESAHTHVLLNIMHCCLKRFFICIPI